MTTARTRFLILTFVLVLCAHARGGNLETVIKSLPHALRSGYSSSVGGGTIYYHSVNAHARNALIARTTDGAQYVEWESDPAPSPVPAGGAAFVWLAALSGSKGVHSFDMSVGGKKMFRFSSLPDSTQKTWKESSPDGSTLTFCATEADRFGDLFGYMFLVLPAGSVKPGARLRLRVDGEAAGSQAWFMVFEHRLSDAAWIRALPALVRTPGGEMQPVMVDIEHYGNPGEADVMIEGGEKHSGRLGWGLSSFTVRSHPVNAAATRRVRVVSGDAVLADTSVTLLPVLKRTL
ncbi:MAG TPA: hypothetical protein VK569_04045, partial [Bacteroidota bacterium]|nr:hypothetical protein [Bacteroidota bacterium]